MSVCTYDNPATQARECWQDGRLFVSYQYPLLDAQRHWPLPAYAFFFGANVGPWKAGQIVGDAGALKAQGAQG